MTNRYEVAAAEVEAQIKELEARLERTRLRDKTGNRVASIETRLAKLRALNLENWRSTGRWAAEIWI
jgi:ribosome-interacting GTPase 1